MKDAITELYAHIIQFFIRAHDWYKEGSFRHVLHSITRPVELRYKDLLDSISECSASIDKLCFSGSQAEQRDMHAKLEVIMLKIDCKSINS